MSLDVNTSIALASAFVAACALGVTIWQGRQNYKHNKLSVRPLLATMEHHHTTDNIGHIAFELINCGVGPAIIKNFVLQRNFDLPEVGEKTHATFDNLLDHFSPAQAFNITWQSVRDTTDYIVRENLPKYRAKNMFIGAVQRKADKYRAEGWEARNSRRDFNCPQTVLSSTFFDTFVRVGEKSFTEQPSCYSIELE